MKFAVFAYPPHGDPARQPLHEGEAVAAGNSVSIRFDAVQDGTLPLGVGDPYRAVLTQIARWIRVQLPHIAPSAIAHRVVHGGAGTSTRSSTMRCSTRCAR